MHTSASELGRLFFELYWRKGFRRILDIGSLDVNGSLRQHRPADAEYIGIDLSEGPGVDLVIEGDPYTFPFPDGHFDAIVSTSCFEHDPMFWLTFLEAARVLSDDGFLYINAPSNGWYHAHPWDNWRFYPDAAFALEQWARRSGVAIHVVESFTAGRAGGDFWNDFVMVFGKGRAVPPRFLGDSVRPVYNTRKIGSYDMGHAELYPEDMLIIQRQQARIRELTGLLEARGATAPALPRLTIYSTAYQRPEQLPVLVHALMCQTFKDFRLVVIHDGEDATMRGLLEQFKTLWPGRLDFQFTQTRYNDYGHSLRAMAIEQCDSEFIMLTNEDNYYVPRFLEFMFEKLDYDGLDLVLCNMIHSHEWQPIGSYGPFVTEPRKFGADIGSFIVKTDLAKAVGFRDKTHDGDGTFMDDIMTRGGRAVKWGKVDKFLFVHN